MTYYWTDKHTWLNDDGCHVPSDYACQLKHRPLVTSTYRSNSDVFKCPGSSGHLKVSRSVP